MTTAYFEGFGSGCLRCNEVGALGLLGPLPYQANDSRTHGRGRNPRRAEFVPGEGERYFSVGTDPIRERAALNVSGDNSLICLVHRGRAEVGDAALHDATVGCEFGKIRTGSPWNLRRRHWPCGCVQRMPRARKTWDVRTGFLVCRHAPAPVMRCA